MTLNLYYWSIRGLNEFLVTLAEYVGIQYKYHKVADRETWNVEKQVLVSKGFEFPNLPYTEHNGQYLSESIAILTQIAILGKREDLVPSAAQIVRFLELNGVISDLAGAITGPGYSAKSNEELQAAIQATINRYPTRIPSLVALVTKHTWILGDNLSILDFKFAEVVERMLDMDKEVGLKGFGVDLTPLRAYLDSFLALPKVKEYRASDRFNARPYNNFFAFWK